MQAETARADLPPETQQVMMLCLSASMMAMMPMMEAASWLVLHAQRDPKVLSNVMIETIGWMTLVTDALIQLLEDAENRARSDRNRDRYPCAHPIFAAIHAGLS